MSMIGNDNEHIWAGDDESASKATIERAVRTGRWWAIVDGPFRATREEAAADRRRMVEALESADELGELRARLATVTNDRDHWRRVASERASGGVLRRLARRLLRPERVR